MTSHLARFVVVGSLFLGLAPLAWADAFLDEASKDFGSVPRGTTLVHPFRLKNPTQDTMHVAGLRASCHCATPTVARTEIPPGEYTQIVVTVDTRKYSGARTFTVFVQIDRPLAAELRLTISATSREDITLTPGQLSYGRVKKGSEAAASVAIDYRGGGVWQITDVENDNGYLLPTLKETSRGPGHASYQLSVKLRQDTPAGVWHYDLWLKTNDPATPRIRVPLMVEVEGNLTATPAELALGRLKSGSRVERKVVIRGTTPFTIKQIDGQDDQIKVTGKFDEPRTVHVLTLSVLAEKEDAEIARTLRVLTSLPEDAAVEFSVQGRVNP